MEYIRGRYENRCIQHKNFSFVIQTTCVVQVRAVKPLTCSTKAYAGVNSVLLTGQFQSGGGKEFQRSSMEVRVRSKAEEEAACQSRGHQYEPMRAVAEQQPRRAKIASGSR